MNAGRSTILVVEDDAPTRAAMGHLLEMEGYRVASAENGQHALHVLEETRPAVVLSDVRMPVMGGEDLVEALRERGGPPVILMTAHAMVDVEAAIRMGAVAVLYKPIEIDELIGLIERVTRSRATEATQSG